MKILPLLIVSTAVICLTRATNIPSQEHSTEVIEINNRRTKAMEQSDALRRKLDVEKRNLQEVTSKIGSLRNELTAKEKMLADAKAINADPNYVEKYKKELEAKYTAYENANKELSAAMKAAKALDPIKEVKKLESRVAEIKNINAKIKKLNSDILEIESRINNADEEAKQSKNVAAEKVTQLKNELDDCDKNLNKNKNEYKNYEKMSSKDRLFLTTEQLQHFGKIKTAIDIAEENKKIINQNIKDAEFQKKNTSEKIKEKLVKKYNEEKKSLEKSLNDIVKSAETKLQLAPTGNTTIDLDPLLQAENLKLQEANTKLNSLKNAYEMPQKKYEDARDAHTKAKNAYDAAKLNKKTAEENERNLTTAVENIKIELGSLTEKEKQLRPQCENDEKTLEQLLASLTKIDGEIKTLIPNITKAEDKIDLLLDGDGKPTRYDSEGRHIAILTRVVRDGNGFAKLDDKLQVLYEAPIEILVNDKKEPLFDEKTKSYIKPNIVAKSKNPAIKENVTFVKINSTENNGNAALDAENRPIANITVEYFDDTNKSVAVNGSPQRTFYGVLDPEGKKILMYGDVYVLPTPHPEDFYEDKMEGDKRVEDVFGRNVSTHKRKFKLYDNVYVKDRDEVKIEVKEDVILGEDGKPLPDNEWIPVFSEHGRNFSLRKDNVEPVIDPETKMPVYDKLNRKIAEIFDAVYYSDGNNEMVTGSKRNIRQGVLGPDDNLLKRGDKIVPPQKNDGQIKREFQPYLVDGKEVFNKDNKKIVEIYEYEEFVDMDEIVKIYSKKRPYFGIVDDKNDLILDEKGNPVVSGKYDEKGNPVVGAEYDSPGGSPSSNSGKGPKNAAENLIYTKLTSAIIFGAVFAAAIIIN